MNHTVKRAMAGALVSCGLAAGLGLGAGAAQAYPMCTSQGSCATQWCPGRSLPAPDVKWDMSVCHDYTSIAYPGSVQVGSRIWEGNPCGPPSLVCFPRKVPS